jgi:hypothetical protein
MKVQQVNTFGENSITPLEECLLLNVSIVTEVKKRSAYNRKIAA